MARVSGSLVDSLHRTVKLELDDGTAASLADAEARARRHVLQVVVGSDVRESVTRQAMLLTAVNAGSRAFVGGVRVLGNLDWSLATPWHRGDLARDVLRRYGATPVHDLDPSLPTVVVGRPAATPVGNVAVRLTWQGWVGGAVDEDDARLAEADEFALAGVLAAGIGVAEAFQSARGSVVAGRRAVGLSLWRPDLHWRDPAAVGGPLWFLPERLWVLGLGHLGQAYLWALGFLPYRAPQDVELTLQDYDTVVEANRSTGLLVVDDEALGRPKTRVVAAAVETLGFRTRVIERRFDDSTRPGPGEPSWAVAGFDKPDPRRALGVFERAVDGGLGARHDDYLALRLHTFPAAGRPEDVFATTSVDAPDLDLPAGYDALVREATVEGRTEAEARCGVVEVAGTAVGAAFVGAVAGALVVADVLRALVEDRTVAVLSMSLASPQHLDVVTGTGGTSNPSFQRVDGERAS
jgi:hypothetical protein